MCLCGKMYCMNITTTYSPWFIILCLLAGGLYASVLYFKNRKEEFSKSLIRILFSVRFAMVALICFFLLSPLIKTTTKLTEKPILIIAQDNSESILINKDSSFYKNTYPNLINDLAEKFKNKFEVKSYTFGDKVKENLNFDYSEKLTDISEVFKFVGSTFYNSNVSALILATDGIYNAGSNPLYATDNINYPVYTLALGDTNTHKDLIIEKLNCNKLVFLNNNFPVEAVVNAFKCKGEKTQISVFYDDKKISSQTIDIAENEFIKTFPFSILADKPGKKKLTVTVSEVKGEITTVNNTVTVYVDVIDSRQKVLILSNAPHPDIAALRYAIESNINYEIKYANINDFTGTIDEYNLIILHNIPSQDNSATNLFKQIDKSNIPVLYILGNQTNINSFNKRNIGLTINNTKSNSFNETLPVPDDDFSFFVLSENTQKTLMHLPPLYSFFGNYVVNPSSVAFLNQKIGNITTKNPLILFNDIGGKKSAVITGEGIWRWRLMDYSENENHNATNEIINKTVQYLAQREEKSNFRVITKDVYPENEPIISDAEVYNDSYEIINSPDVLIVIKNKDNNAYQFSFSKTSSAYTLNAGLLPVGDYTYDAKVKVGPKIYTKIGKFIVSKLHKEAVVTNADHKLLFNLSSRHKGSMYYPRETEKLYDDIINNDEFKPVIHETLSTSELINIKSLLFLIVFLLGLEWFLRKRSGSY